MGGEALGAKLSVHTGEWAPQFFPDQEFNGPTSLNLAGDPGPLAFDFELKYMHLFKDIFKGFMQTTLALILLRPSECWDNKLAQRSHFIIVIIFQDFSKVPASAGAWMDWHRICAYRVVKDTKGDRGPGRTPS